MTIRTQWNPARREFEAVREISQEEAEFIADTLESVAPYDTAGTEWREIADRLVFLNAPEEE